MNVIYKILAALISLSVMAAAVLAYLIRKVDVERQIVYDGLGRALSQPPPWARFFTQEPAWAGAGWHLLDIVVFFGGLFLALWLYGLSKDDSSHERNTPDAPRPPQPDEVEMLDEVLDLLASDEYAAMSEADRKIAVATVKQKHGF